MIRNVEYYSASNMYKDISSKVSFGAYNRCRILGKIALFYIEFHTYSVVNGWETIAKPNMNYNFLESLFHIRDNYNGGMTIDGIYSIQSLPANSDFSANFVAYIS